MRTDTTRKIARFPGIRICDDLWSLRDVSACMAANVCGMVQVWVVFHSLDLFCCLATLFILARTPKVTPVINQRSGISATIISSQYMCNFLNYIYIVIYSSKSQSFSTSAPFSIFTFDCFMKINGRGLHYFSRLQRDSKLMDP